MGNVTQIRNFRSDEAKDFTREVPEHETLINLAMRRPVKLFEIEHASHGYKMLIAHFDDGEWHHWYQDSDGAFSSHLFFWVMAWKGEKTAEEMVLEFFDDKFILCDDL